MIYKYEPELRRGADICSEALRSKGYSAYILGDSFREYHVKLSVNGSADYGSFSVYYSPKKKKYSLVTTEIKFPAMAEKITEICLPVLNTTLSFESTEQVVPPEWSKLPELYVDGSFRNNITSYAFALVEKGKVVHSGAGVMREEETQGTHQIAGELEAIIKGIEWCAAHNYKTVVVCHDLINSQKWATGQFKANNAVTQRYVRFIKNCGVDMRWKKIAAHTGVKFNEYVDRLAAKAVEDFIAKSKMKG